MVPAGGETRGLALRPCIWGRLCPWGLQDERTLGFRLQLNHTVLA